MSVEIDYTCTDFIICPFCGYRFVDSWELDKEGEIDCDCGMTFSYYSEISVQYWSQRDCALNKESHNWVFALKLSRSNMERCTKCDQIRFIELRDCIISSA